MSALVTIYVKITNPAFGEPWYASHMFDSSRSTIEKQIALMNKRGTPLGSTYALATKDEYWAYRNKEKK